MDQVLDIPGDEHRVKAIFDKYDQDRNGVIDVDEFRLIIKDHLKEMCVRPHVTYVCLLLWLLSSSFRFCFLLCSFGPFILPL